MLTPTDGRVPASSNQAGVQGPFITYSDGHAQISVGENTGRMCISGQTAQVVDGDWSEYFGAGLSLNLNQPEGAAGAWDGSGYTGVSFTLTGTFQQVNFVLRDAGGTEYCTEGLSMGANTIVFGELQQECWEPPGATPTAATMANLNRFQWYVSAAESGPVDFDFCISDVTLIAGAGTPTTQQPPPPPTMKPAGIEKFVGNITSRNQIRNDFLDYWDQITPENEGKWDAVEFQRGNMNWGAVDRIYDFARSNGIPFKQHTFVWGKQSPQWMNGLSGADQAQEIEEWIRLFCERYPDTEMIDVVNEPEHATPSFIGAMGGAGTTGHDWVIWAFEKARQHCPGSILILNDYNVLRWDTEEFVAIAQKVADAGYLDAIGCQSHGLEDITFAELQQNLARVESVGVPIYISEYDLDIASDSEQERVMAEQFPLFYERPSIEGITLWGYIFGETWVADSGLIRGGQQRPAMTWLMTYLGR